MLQEHETNSKRSARVTDLRRLRACATSCLLMIGGQSILITKCRYIIAKLIVTKLSN